MPNVNNIFNIKITSVAGNGSVNFGNTLHKGHSFIQKRVGGYTVVGDGTLSNNREVANVNDPDLADQNNSQL
ncbi:hypothetical protein BG53_07275 [Paenibacillus darwinianus]|uniref:Uncharacterized protein n=1 Tax=Paenibacillus darwinianus TaxID=1380763 RepID=A0A9W5W6U3_9BACL|nr:spore germination protein [Paenibacillus darwinianus]EXX85779.1 hypothetical protein CH50_08760 [Paenibacillus darwinianus]EXX85950.1 hypothetical protein BG53_07275 [Paenibacillus darwinianus]EXX88658.1 hypothetical protein BG52_01510 [Paenibacillus darwinianus]